MTTLASFLLAVSAFTFLYFLAPNAPVRFRSALAGGLVAGAAWDLSRYGYTLFGAEIFRYNPVYGSLGAMPLFLAWIYLSWLVVLFGARLAYAVEHAAASGLLRALGKHPRACELVAARIAEEVSLAQLDATAPPTARELCRLLEVSEERVHEAVERLVRKGLLIATKAGGLVPARLPEQLTLAELSWAVGGLPPARPGFAAKEETFRGVEEIFARNDEAAKRALEQISWADLANQRRNPRAAEEAPATERVEAAVGRRIL
jgi:membrane protein